MYLFNFQENNPNETPISDAEAFIMHNSSYEKVFIVLVIYILDKGKINCCINKKVYK